MNVDIVAYCRALPRPGETIHAERSAIGLGGKGANQAASAARIAGPSGTRVAMVGRVGADPFGELAREALGGFGVELAALRRDPEHPTGFAMISIDAAGENAITVAGGANMALDAADVDAAASLISGAAVLLLQLETPVAVSLRAARLARAAGVTVILDPAPAQTLPDELWQSIDLITPNESETEQLVGLRPTGLEAAAAAADRLQARGVARAIVKLGAGGVYWRDGRQGGFVPAFKVEAIDSVAAGDCFNGGLAVALARGDGLAEAVRFAAACGALATTRRGAAEAAPIAGEVAAMLG